MTLFKGSIITFCISLIFLIQSCEQSFDQKYRKIQGIEQDYKSTRIKSSSNIIQSPRIIELYLEYLQTLNGANPNFKEVKDSLYQVILQRSNIDVDKLRADTARIAKIMPYYYSSNNNDEMNFKKNMYIAFANDIDRDYNDIIYYLENGYFENGTRPSEGISDNVSIIRAEEVEKWTTGWNGEIRDFVSKVKSKLKDPDSFKHIETSYSTKGGKARVRMKFSAKNSFNASSTSVYEAILNISNGTVSELKLIE